MRLLPTLPLIVLFAPYALAIQDLIGGLATLASDFASPVSKVVSAVSVIAATVIGESAGEPTILSTVGKELLGEQLAYITAQAVCQPPAVLARTCGSESYSLFLNFYFRERDRIRFGARY